MEKDLGSLRHDHLVRWVVIDGRRKVDKEYGGISHNYG